MLDRFHSAVECIQCSTGDESKGITFKDHLYFMKNRLSTLTCYQYYSITQSINTFTHTHTKLTFTDYCHLFLPLSKPPQCHVSIPRLPCSHTHTHTHTCVCTHARMRTHTQETGWRESRLPLTTLQMKGANCTPQKPQSLLP